MALLEAMAAGLPVVATGVGGIGDVVVDGETGVLVEPGDPGAVADALSALAGSEDLRRRLGDAGRARGEALRRRVLTARWRRIYGARGSGSDRANVAVRVALVHPEFHLGGSLARDRVLLAGALARREHDVHVYASPAAQRRGARA